MGETLMGQVHGRLSPVGWNPTLELKKSEEKGTAKTSNELTKTTILCTTWLQGDRGPVHGDQVSNLQPVKDPMRKQGNITDTASGGKPTLGQLYHEGHRNDTHWNTKWCEEKGAAERNSYELTVTVSASLID
ncbi:hypothetical protein WISP_142301 [Willisornis vidua]|uniref:Uncharacterized protein n=1 Tax=Willisornis vidua TaxID=1566151 RepID=A0ABQ9CLN3_9PASS|nr:hypothetical protein WISP_142301 [Willisornis vidua]